jgi:hypothetical protein
MNKLFAWAAAATAILLAGCLKEELPVPAHPRGDAVVCVAHVGPDYANQLWFDLGSHSVVAQNSKMDWDLAFECGTEGWQVRLNQARLMRAHRTGQDAIDLPTDTTGYGNTWKVDLPNGRPDSLAFGDWRQGQPVFAVDLGYDVIGLPIGLRKLQLLAVTEQAYQFRMASITGGDVQDFTVQKDPARAYVHFSFTTGTPVTIAPPLGSYDLVFTQYTEQFHAPDPYLAYLVTGTLNGFSGARVAEITGDFDAVTLADTLAHPFSTDEDAVGYDWKDYSFDTGTYLVHADKVYIVQDSEGYFFKLHFTDYYDDQGQRGSPTFEVVPL